MNALLGSWRNVHRLSGIWYFWPDHLCSLKRCFNMSLIHESDISTTPNSASEAAPSSVTHKVHGPNYNEGTSKSRNKVMWHQQSAPPPDLNDISSCCYNTSRLSVYSRDQHSYLCKQNEAAVPWGSFTCNSTYHLWSLIWACSTHITRNIFKALESFAWRTSFFLW